MKVCELIEVLQRLKNQEAKVVFKDSAAGHRHIDYIEEFLNGYQYIITGEVTKRKS